MASVEYIEKRVAGKENEIAKLERRMARILKAKESGWEENPYYYDEGDLQYTADELKEAEAALEGWQEKLRVAMEKANSRDVKVIVDFLNEWKEKTREFYMESFPKYRKDLEKYYEKDREYCEWFNYSRRDATAEEKKERKEEIEKVRKNFKARWGWFEAYVDCTHRKIEEERLDRDLKNEADRKYDFIIERTNKIVGQITDASNLYIGSDAELNGFIIGEKGIAKVQTIGAGGWNIQRYHFRTLVHEMK